MKIGKPSMAAGSALDGPPIAATPEPKKSRSKGGDKSDTKTEIVFVRPAMSGPTSETPPRCELCGITEDNKKMHIYSTTKERQFSVMTKVRDEMIKRKFTKKQVLAMRDDLLASDPD
eukprot:9487703-Pyramimonas_sp.AAC.1